MLCRYVRHLLLYSKSKCKNITNNTLLVRFLKLNLKNFSTLSEAKINEIPSIGLRQIKFNGLEDSKFWNEFMSTTSNNLRALSPHSLAILSSVLIHLIPTYPYSKTCIKNIFEIIKKRPVILNGLNIELLNMLLVSYYTLNSKEYFNIAVKLINRCNEELKSINADCVELNIEVIHSLARCVRNEKILLDVLRTSEILKTISIFIYKNIDKLNPRELSIIIYSLSTFNNLDSKLIDLITNAVNANLYKFQPLDISTIVFTSKENSYFINLIPLFKNNIVKYMLDFTPQQVSNILYSFIKYSNSTIANRMNVDNEVNLLLERASEVCENFKPQELFNIINIMLRHNLKPSLKFLKSYSQYLLTSDFNNFTFVDLFTLFNSLSQWNLMITEFLGKNLTSLVEKSANETVKYINRNLSRDKLIYIIYYISRVSSTINPAIKHGVGIISSFDLKALNVKELCLIKGSITKFIPVFTQLNEELNEVFIEMLKDNNISFNSMDFRVILEGINNEQVYDLAIRRAFELDFIPMSLLYTILNSGCSPEIVGKVYEYYMKNVRKLNHLSVLDGYKAAIVLSSKGYINLYLDYLENIAISGISKFKPQNKLNNYVYTLLISLSRLNYSSQSIEYLLKTLHFDMLNRKEKALLIHSFVAMDLYNKLNVNVSTLKRDVLTLFSISWLIYMGKIDFSIYNIFSLLNIFTGGRTYNMHDNQEKAQMVKSLYMLLNTLTHIFDIDLLNLKALRTFNNILQQSISNTSRDYAPSKYSNDVYDITKTIYLRDIKTESTAGLDYRIDLLLDQRS